MIKPTLVKRRTPKLLPWFLVVLAIALLGLYGSKFAPLPAQLSINQISNQSGEVSLSFNPGALSATVGNEASANLLVNTGNIKLVVLTVELTYDPSKLEGVKVTQGSLLPNTLASPKVENGKITFTYAATPESGGVTTTSGDIATITFKPKSSDNTALAFSSTSLATGIDADGNRIPTNILKSAADLSITFTKSSNSSDSTAASPTPTPTSTSNTVSVVTTTTTTTTTPKKTAAPKVSTASTPTAPDPTPNPTVTQNTYIDPDNFLSPAPSPNLTSSETSKPGILRQIFLGWSIILRSIFDFLFG